MNEIEKINSILKVTNHDFHVELLSDGEIFAFTENTNMSVEDFRKEQTQRIRLLITNLIDILKNQQKRLQYRLLFDVYGLDSEKEKLNEIRKIWEG